MSTIAADELVKPMGGPGFSKSLAAGCARRPAK
jgi:hypothetical protein